MRKGFYFLTSVYVVAVLGLFFACQQRQNNRFEPQFGALDAADSARVKQGLYVLLRKEMYADEMYSFDTSFNMFGCMGLNYKLRIKVNNRHEISVRGEQVKNTVTQSVCDYFTANLEQNDPTNNYPMYYSINREELEDGIEGIEEELRMLENTPNASEEVIAVKRGELDEWKFNLRALDVLNTKVLRLVSPSTEVELDYPSTFGSSSVELKDSILEAFYLLRNQASMRYFRESYLSILYRFALQKSPADKEKLQILRMLHPIRVRDIPYCLKNGIWTPYTIKLPVLEGLPFVE